MLLMPCRVSSGKEEGRKGRESEGDVGREKKFRKSKGRGREREGE